MDHQELLTEERAEALVRTKEGDRVNERLYKRKIRLLISIVLVLVMAFSGCNGKQKSRKGSGKIVRKASKEKKGNCESG